MKVMKLVIEVNFDNAIESIEGFLRVLAGR